MSIASRIFSLFILAFIVALPVSSTFADAGGMSARLSDKKLRAHGLFEGLNPVATYDVQVWVRGTDGTNHFTAIVTLNNKSPEYKELTEFVKFSITMDSNEMDFGLKLEGDFAEADGVDVGFFIQDIASSEILLNHLMELGAAPTSDQIDF